MTEEEAKTKWCPFARVEDCEGATDTVANRTTRAEGWNGAPPFTFPSALCIGSACMAWRWTFGGPSTPPHEGDPGYCGLAGKPQ